MSESVIIDAVRSPIGVKNGELIGIRPDDLSAQVVRQLLDNDKHKRIASIPGDGHSVDWNEGDHQNVIEALVKPIGVVEGISDLPWHKDCSLG